MVYLPQESREHLPKDFFFLGRNMPWWLLGVFNVATTFSADTQTE